MEKSSKLKIGILYTGGTIGCTGSPLKPMSGADFSGAFDKLLLPTIKSKFPNADIEISSFAVTLDSTNLKPIDWCKIATDILSNFSDHDAFIVLHGTDTMAWTASALSFLLTGLDGDGNIIALLNKPVIITGAQLPLFSETKDSSYILNFNTDAYQNICGAIASCYQGVPEVCLYFNDTLMRGNRTVKTNASEFDAFSSPNYPDLGRYGLEFQLNHKAVRHLPTIPFHALSDESAFEALRQQVNYVSEHIKESIVMPFPAFPADYDNAAGPNTSVLGDMLAACMDKGVNGLILESYGGGNFPSGNPTTPAKGAVYQVLRKAHQNNVVLIDCTQVLTGSVNSQTYASGSWLSEVGALGSYDMTPIAALTKLIYLITLAGSNKNNWNQSMIEKLMLTNLVGEMVDVNTLDVDS